MSQRKQMMCLECRIGEGESFEVAETLIADAIQNARRPTSRLGIGLDLVATPPQIRSGAARAIAEHLLRYMDEHYPELFAACIGITDNANRLPLRGLTTGRLSEADIDNVHLFVLGGQYVSPPETIAEVQAAASDPTSLIMPDQNAVYWGNVDGPFIEIIGLPAEVADLPQAELDKRQRRGPLRAAFMDDPVASVSNFFLFHPARWSTADDFAESVAGMFPAAAVQALASQLQLRAGWTTFIGVDHRETSDEGFFIEMRVTYPGDLTPLQALQAIEAAEYVKGNVIPAHVFAAIYAAMMVLRQRAPAVRQKPGLPQVAAMILGRICHHYAQECYQFEPFDELPSPPLDNNLIAGMAAALCEGVGVVSVDPEREIPILRPTDLVRVLVEAGRRLWEEEARRSVLDNFHSFEMVERSSLFDFNILVQAYLLMQPEAIAEVAGVRLACDAPEELFYAYLQVLEMVDTGMPAEAVRALLPDGRLPGVNAGTGLNVEVDGAEKAAAPRLPAELAPLAAGLRRLAAEPAHYIPSGVFELRVPRQLAILRSAGIERLAVYVNSAGMWLRLRGGADALVGWSPDSPVHDWVVESRLAIGLEMLAWALWVDLRQSGASAFPRVDRRREPQSGSGEFSLSGERQWLKQSSDVQARGLSALLAGLAVWGE